MNRFKVTLLSIAAASALLTGAAYSSSLAAPAARQTATPQVTQPPAEQKPSSTRYVGRFLLGPAEGPSGTAVKAMGNGFAPNTKLDIVWQAIRGSWKVNDSGEFHGREFKEVSEPRDSVTTDAAGQFETTFTVPDGFGFIHDVLVMKDGEIQNKAGFNVDMRVSLSPLGGPEGTPITISAKVSAGGHWKIAGLCSTTTGSLDGSLRSRRKALPALSFRLSERRANT